MYFDKPVALCMKDVWIAQKISVTTGAKVMGGSALRYSKELSKIHSELSARPPLSIVVSGPGPWFEYACHMVEILTVLFGNEIVKIEGSGTQSEGVVTLKWKSAKYASIQFGPEYKGFSVHAMYPLKTSKWTIEDETDYYRGLSSHICDTLIDESNHDAWKDIIAVVDVLEKGDHFLSQKP